MILNKMPDTQTGTAMSEALHTAIIEILYRNFTPSPIVDNVSIEIQDVLDDIVATYTNGSGLDNKAEARSMLDLELAGKHVKVFPGDSVKKWGVILHSTKEGLFIKATRCSQGGWSSNDGWNVGSVHFLPWGKIKFEMSTKEEACK